LVVTETSVGQRIAKTEARNRSGQRDEPDQSRYSRDLIRSREQSDEGSVQRGRDDKFPQPVLTSLGNWPSHRGFLLSTTREKVRPPFWVDPTGKLAKKSMSNCQLDAQRRDWGKRIGKTDFISFSTAIDRCSLDSSKFAVVYEAGTGIAPARGTFAIENEYDDRTMDELCLCFHVTGEKVIQYIPGSTTASGPVSCSDALCGYRLPVGAAVF